MSRRPDINHMDSALTYRYDGSFEGFLCCVFESYAAHELPAAIVGPDAPELSLFGIKEIPTDEERAAACRENPDYGRIVPFRPISGRPGRFRAALCRSDADGKL